jgi:hypothetical protein
MKRLLKRIFYHEIGLTPFYKKYSLHDITSLLASEDDCDQRHATLCLFSGPHVVPPEKLREFILDQSKDLLARVYGTLAAAVTGDQLFIPVLRKMIVMDPCGAMLERALPSLAVLVRDRPEKRECANFIAAYLENNAFASLSLSMIGAIEYAKDIRSLFNRHYKRCYLDGLEHIGYEFCKAEGSREDGMNLWSKVHPARAYIIALRLLGEDIKTVDIATYIYKDQNLQDMLKIADEVVRN